MYHSAVPPLKEEPDVPGAVAGCGAARMVARMALLAAWLCAAWLQGCERGSSPGRPAPRMGPVRIVSLSPAVTSALVALGVGDQVVGRTPWCRGLPAEVPVVGDATSVDLERLVALRPTHVLMQATQAAGDHGLSALAGERGWRLAAFRLDRLDDVDAMIAGVGRVLGVEVSLRADDLRRELSESLAPCPAAARLGRTMLLFQVSPVMTFGPASYVGDIWSRLGGTNAVGRGAYPELSVEDVLAFDPDALVVFGDPDLLLKARRLPIRAVREGRVFHASDARLLQPGGDLAAGIGSLRAAIDCGDAAP